MADIRVGGTRVLRCEFLCVGIASKKSYNMTSCNHVTALFTLMTQLLFKSTLYNLEDVYYYNIVNMGIAINIFSKFKKDLTCYIRL